MTDVILWVLAVEAVGLVAFPICFFLFPSLSDRGFGICKPLGIIAVAYISWILSAAQLVPSTQITLALILAALAALSGTYAWRQRAALLAFVKKERRALLTAEALFLLVFAGWALFRACDPAIAATEQPMDFGFLNASVRTYLGEPEDPWLRGESISYYYFGYWMMGSLTKLTGVHPAIAYNLSLTLIPALAAMGIFSLVVGMVRSESKGLRYALTAGFAAAALLVLAANLEGVLEFMRANGLGSAGFWQWMGVDGLDEPLPAPGESWRPQEFLWWWRASRVIGSFDGDTTLDYTIHEFPFFSFIVGDLHPHVMSIPFVVTFLTMLWAYLRSPLQGWPLSRAALAGNAGAPLASLGRSAAAPAAMGLVLGALAFTNMWDLPVFAALLVGVAGVRAYSARPNDLLGLVKQIVSASLPVIALALVLIAPYLVSFGSQVSGIGAVGVYATRPHHLLIVWGLFLLAVAPVVVSVFWRTTVDRDWRPASAISLLAGFLPFVVWAIMSFGGDASRVARLLWVLPFALLIGAAVFGALWLSKQDDPPRGLVYALMLAALGILLMMGPELLHVDDSFGGALERMNTVFKLYYQAWILLSASAGYAIFYMLKLRDGAEGGALALARVWTLAFVVLLACSAYYPLAAAAHEGDPQGRDPTLDGLAHLAGDERAAIEFIRNDAGRDSAVLEAFGNDYTPFGRVSSGTGVPTILGWAGHEVQWRGSPEPLSGRQEDIEAIYTTEDVEEARRLLDKYGVDYVYVGDRERQAYGEAGLAKFGEFMDAPFQQGGVTVYRRGGWRR